MANFLADCPIWSKKVTQPSHKKQESVIYLCEKSQKISTLGNLKTFSLALAMLFGPRSFTIMNMCQRAEAWCVLRILIVLRKLSKLKAKLRLFKLAPTQSKSTCLKKTASAIFSSRTCQKTSQRQTSVSFLNDTEISRR